jgi:hypothetical protein
LRDLYKESAPLPLWAILRMINDVIIRKIRRGGVLT